MDCQWMISWAISRINLNFRDICLMKEVGITMIKNGFVMFYSQLIHKGYKTWLIKLSLQERKEWKITRIWWRRWDQSLPKLWRNQSVLAVTLNINNFGNIADRGKSASLLKPSSKLKRKRSDIEEVKEEEKKLKSDRQN